MREKAGRLARRQECAATKEGMEVEQQAGKWVGVRDSKKQFKQMSLRYVPSMRFIPFNEGSMFRGDNPVEPQSGVTSLVGGRLVNCASIPSKEGATGTKQNACNNLSLL